MRYLLDTCAIPELVSQVPNLGVVEWIDAAEEDHIYFSTITIGEIKKGICKLGDTLRRRALSEWLDDDLLIRFEGRILPVDTGVMLVWGELTAELESRGRPLPATDSLIAAIALRGDLCLVTRNEAGFADTGAQTVNPWAP